MASRNALPNVGVKTGLKTGVYRCIDSGGLVYSMRIGLRQIGNRYQYVTAREGEKGGVAYALHHVSGQTYLAATEIAKGSSSIGVVILRVDADNVEYVFAPVSLVESLAPRHGVRVNNSILQNNALSGSPRNQLALMKAVARRVQLDGASERCARFS